MKTKILLTSVIALGVSAAIVGGFALNTNNEMIEASAYSYDDGYAATDDHFIASFHGNKKLKTAYNDTGSDSTRLENITISGMDNTSSIDWKVSIAKYSHDTFQNLKMGNKGATIENHFDSEFADIYSSLGVGSGHYASAMYTTTAISNIQDIAVSWGASGGNVHSGNQSGNIYLLYKESGGSWTKIYVSSSSETFFKDTKEGTDDVGTSGTWNHYRSNYKRDYISRSNLTGKTAQIAIAYDGAKDASTNSFVCLHTLIINRVASIKAMMNHWDKSGDESELCTSLLNSADRKTSGYVRMAMFAKSLEQSQANELNVATDFHYGNAKENTYYNQLAYFCGVAGLSLHVSPSSSNYINRYIHNNSGLMVCVILMITGMVGAGAYITIKKKKHN